MLVGSDLKAAIAASRGLRDAEKARELFAQRSARWPGFLFGYAPVAGQPGRAVVQTFAVLAAAAQIRRHYRIAVVKPGETRDDVELVIERKPRYAIGGAR